MKNLSLNVENIAKDPKRAEEIKIEISQFMKEEIHFEMMSNDAQVVYIDNIIDQRTQQMYEDMCPQHKRDL